MGRFERDIRKKMKESDQSFDEWFAEHRDRLTNFEPPEEPASDLGPVRVRRRTFAWLTGAVALLLVAFIVTAVFLFRGRSQSQPQLPSQPQIPDLSFGEEGVYMEALTAEELQQTLQQVPALTRLTVTEQRAVRHQQDDSTVMVIVIGEQETKDDYYFVEAKVQYNENYNFSEKMYYEDLKNKTVIGNTQVSYDENGTDKYGFAEYRILSETDGATVYWTVSSVNDLLEEWLQLTFGN